MTPEPKSPANDDQALSPELERHLANPAEMTEEVSGEQERARKARETPTEPGASTESQPTLTPVR